MKTVRNAKKGNRVRRLELSKSVLAALERLGILRPSDKLGERKFGVAVSGGADSVALLNLLLEVRDELAGENCIELAVAHFNHRLRGRAADADERFVRSLAEKHALKFYLGSADVGAAAKRAKRNLEDAGRRARYAYFARLQKKGCVDWVATAHTMNDQAETVLAHVLRGSGLAGLGGIHAVSGCVVRPLLGVRRAELRAYLRFRGQKWREDASNQDTTKSRARIRRKLIPSLEKHFQAHVVEHLAGLAERAREDEEYLDAAVARRLAEIREDANGVVRVRVQELYGKREQILAAPLQRNISGRGEAQHFDALSGRIVRKLVKECKARDGELGAQHIASVRELASLGESGKSLVLPGGVEVRKEKNALIFLALAAPTGTPVRDASKKKLTETIAYEHEIDLRGGAAEVRVPLLKRAFHFTEIDWPRERRETNERRVVLDCARLQFPLVLRNWRPGDRLQPAGRRNAHKLKRLLNEKGVNRWERNGWPVLTSGGELLWSRGFPVAAKYRAGEKTEAGLVIDEEPL